MKVDPADLFPGRNGAKQAEKENAWFIAAARLTRSARYGWEWVTWRATVGLDETWYKGLQGWLFRGGPPKGPFLVPEWFPPLVGALIEAYTPRGPRITRDLPKPGKIRSEWLEMLLSWTAAGGKDALTRGKALAAVIALDSHPIRSDRIDVFINDYDGP